jgi:UDP-GlcNAc:undecaprenyl-phosphate GlcNAc-1-phosphate transferase
VGLALLLTVLYLLFVSFFWVYLARVKIYAEKSILSNGKSGVLTPILVEISYRRRLFEVLLDFVLISVAYYAAYILRFEGQLDGNLDFFLKSLPIVVACQVFAFYIMGVYRGVWERTGVRDLISYVKAITLGTVMPMLFFLFLVRFQSFSRAVFVIYWGLVLIFVSLSRLSFRMLDEGIRIPSRKGLRTLIYGAGLGGQMALKEIGNNSELGLQPIGFIDDNLGLHGRRIQGYPVLGSMEDLEDIIRKHDIQKIIVSFKQNGEERARNIRASCLRKGIEVDVRQMRVVIS